MIASHEAALQACRAFPIGDASSAVPLGNGHIHETWLIETGGAKYVLQRLNPQIGAAETQNVALVTQHLAAQGLLTPRLIASLAGTTTHQTTEGTWRVLTFIEGTTIESNPSVAQARSAAGLLARFHTSLADMHEPLPYALPHFHDTAYELTRLQQIHRPETSLEKYQGCEPVARRVIELLEPRARMFEQLPRRMVHADPKINNFRFDIQGENAICLLDLDTVGYHPLPIEIGDMLRSCTAIAGGPRIDADVWRAIVDTYRSSARFLTEEESRFIPDGYLVYALELAARSITDAYEERLFRFDPSRFPTLFAQNLARAQLQLARAEEFLVREDELRAL